MDINNFIANTWGLQLLFAEINLNMSPNKIDHYFKMFSLPLMSIKIFILSREQDIGFRLKNLKISSNSQANI